MASATRPPNAGTHQIKPTSAIRSCVVRLRSAQTCRETTTLKINVPIAIETAKGTSISYCLVYSVGRSVPGVETGTSELKLTATIAHAPPTGRRKTTSCFPESGGMSLNAIT
jgi:hypothetical protein